MANRKLETMTAPRLEETIQQTRQTLTQIAKDAPTVGVGLTSAEARKAREAVIAKARETKALGDAAKAELAQREARQPRMSLMDRFRGTPNVHEQKATWEARQAQAVVERKAFHAEVKAARDERNAEALRRRRDAGLLYEPTGDGGGDAVAALFSSRVLWDYTERKIQSDGIVGQILNARHIIALWWVSNLIAEHGGEEATFAANTIPHWPDIDGDILFREADIAHLTKNGFIDVERQNGAGGSITYRFGKRTLALIQSYREWTSKTAT